MSAGHRARAQPAAEIALEFGDAVLVGDAEVEGGIAAVGGVEDGLEERRVEEEALAFRGGAVDLGVAFDLEALAIVEHALAAGGDVLPQRAELGLVFGHGRIGAAEEGAAAGLGAVGGIVAAAAVAGGPRGVEEGSGIDAHHPAVAVRRNIGVDDRSCR